ncbi:IS481 family transposase, partial [Acidithiobacillus ferrooxidans]|nr:IS481 family transposase [Acidithiobacillus ferrooxidans]
MKTRIDSPQRDRWALLRFAIIGPLLAAPPAPGELALALKALSARSWRHPRTGEPVRFGFSTLERWYYRVRAAENPVLPLRNRLRSN